MSDREIVLRSDFLKKLENMSNKSNQQLVVMADRGFNIQDILLKYNMKLAIPPFLKGQDQFTEEDNIITKCVANARIHVERVIGMLKVFKILKHTVPSELYDLIDHMFVICGAIVNLNGPIIPLS